MNKTTLGVGIILGVAGSLYLMREFGKELAVEGQHWIMLLVILIAGYVAGRLFPQAGRMVGLP